MSAQSLTALRSAFELANKDPFAFAAKFPAKPAPVAKPKSARDWTRDVDAAILEAAAKLVEDLVPEDKRDAVAQLVANQLHHLSTPALGWVGTLPRPARSEWNLTVAA